MEVSSNCISLQEMADGSESALKWAKEDATLAAEAAAQIMEQ